MMNGFSFILYKSLACLFTRSSCNPPLFEQIMNKWKHAFRSFALAAPCGEQASEPGRENSVERPY